jgi:hypothetical protein
MLDHSPTDNLPEWIEKLSDDEKRALISHLSESLEQSPSPAQPAPQKPRRKKAARAKELPESVQKYARPLREKIDLEEIMRNQGYTGPNWKRFQKAVKSLDIKEPIELLLSQLTK